jgi:hypothetical protein
MLAAEAGAIIAIAAGLYTEQIPDIEKPLRFWGRCPDLVTLKPGVGTVVINVWSEQAIGTEIHTLQIDGGGFGVRNIAAEGVLVDRVWVHDTDYHGFRVHGWNGSTDNASLTIRGSLVEGSGYLGINSAGNDIVIEDTVVRNSSGAGDGGIVLQAYPFPNGLTGVPDATIRRVLVEQTKRVGMLFYGARALVEDSLVRDIEPIDGMGRGIEADYLAIASPQVMMASELTLRRSVIENATEVGVLAGGSTATLQHVVVRGTRPSPVSGHASAVHAQPHEGAPPMLTMDASLVTDTVGTSVVLASGVVAIDKSIIVDSRGVAGNTYGVGVLTTSLDVDDPPGTLTVTQSRVVRSDDVGIALYDRDASIHGTLIDDTRILSGDLGGTGVLTSFHAPNDPNVAVISSVIRRSRGIGVRASGANISMTATLLDNELLAPGFLASYGTHRLTGSVIANTSAYGVSLEGGDLEMEGLLVRDVDRGPAIQLFATTEGGSHFVLRESALVRARSQALLAVESQGTVEATVIDGVTPGLDGYFGDGITVMGGAHPASVDVRGSVIGNTTRAGIANFGAHLGLRAVALQCSSFFLNGERFGDLDYIYEDLGGNSCTCNGVSAACKVISSSPEVPAPSAPVTPDGTIPVGGVDPNEPGS